MSLVPHKLQEISKEWLPLIALPISAYVLYKTINRLIPGAHNLPRVNFQNKTALITGASSGLGKALAFEFFKRGANVILLARSTDKLRLICEELKATFPLNQNEPIYYYFDMNEIENGPWSEIPKIDFLINNAGMSSRGNTEDVSIEIHKRVMDTNFFGHIDVTRILLDRVHPTGSIVVTSSVQGKVALANRSSYGASKHALQGYFDSLRAEYKDRHVLVVSAGYINTGFGTRSIDPRGEAVGVEDENQKKGYSPELSAKLILDAIRERKSDYVMAPFDAKVAIFLRYAWPTLLNYVLYLRGAKEPWAKRHEKKQH